MRRLQALIKAVAMIAVLSVHAEASASDKALRLYHMNTQESLEIIFKRDGVYDQAALEKLNWFFRDWRKNQPKKMDPQIFDLLSDIYDASGSRSRIEVLCGYRSSETNALLRSRSKAVAKESQHIQGKAVDFKIPDIPIKRLREIAIRMQGGGVGFYPHSRSPFVHVDVASVRYWPKVDDSYLSAIMESDVNRRSDVNGPEKPFSSVISAIKKASHTEDVKSAYLGETALADRVIDVGAVPIPAERPDTMLPLGFKEFALNSRTMMDNEAGALLVGSASSQKRLFAKSALGDYSAMFSVPGEYPRIALEKSGRVISPDYRK